MFNKNKFSRLEPRLQHKKCAELLRLLYDGKADLETYNLYLSWMNQAPFETTDRKLIADRYHWHLNLADLCLKEHNLLPAMRTGDHEPQCPFPDIAIYLDNVRSAYNVGSILRTVEALRIGSLHFSGNTPYVNNEKIIRTSMGASTLVPCYPDATLDTLPRPIIVLDTCVDAIPVSEFIFPPSFTLILGNEEYGVSESSLKAADHLIEIPLVGMKNSINIGCAFAIAAAEIRRQRTLSALDTPLETLV